MKFIPFRKAASYAQRPHHQHHLSTAQQQQKYRIETHSKILPYVIRDNAWNFEHHDNTNFNKYMADGPKEYATEVDYDLPNPTNTASDPAPLEPCTAAEEVELINEKATAKTQGLPAPEPWCKSAVEDPEDPAATDDAAAEEAPADAAPAPKAKAAKAKAAKAPKADADEAPAPNATFQQKNHYKEKRSRGQE